MSVVASESPDRVAERELWRRFTEHARSGGAGRAGRALHAVGAADGKPLRRRLGAVRRSVPGRQSRPAERRRPLRREPRHALRGLRQADDPRRAEALLPRQSVDGAGAPLGPRPDGRSREGDREADPGAGPAAVGRGAGRAGRDRCRRGARGARGQAQPQAAIARRASGRRGPRRSLRRRVGRSSPTATSTWSKTASRWRRCCRSWASANARCCGCASPRNCRRPRSPCGSAARRCTSPAFCAARSTSCARRPKGRVHERTADDDGVGVARPNGTGADRLLRLEL